MENRSDLATGRLSDGANLATGRLIFPFLFHREGTKTRK